jgi:zinc transport system substrate-binding protein
MFAHAGGTKRARAAIAIVCALGCSGAERQNVPQVADAGPLSVYVVNQPLQYFAERIGGEHVEVVLPAPQGVDPAFWQPSADVVSDYQSADLILENGAGYAAWTRHTTLPRASRVDTSAGFGDRLIVESGAVTHGHGPEGDHTHNASRIEHTQAAVIGN